MEVSLRDWFMARWRKYFDGAELPIAFYYTDREGSAQAAKRRAFSSHLPGGR